MFNVFIYGYLKIKCRKYKNSEQIRNDASECFNKFCQM